ncbi:hypothetical protein CONLIGDRAFT_668831 [Coniochaeta ligniaria NRRL 30616]|uniref:Uncharacterized protein n=1 Tax=Coniochaeta ligniaria NRRL 30616 TaxID=1408157 RepID=A0A1J7ITY2_9PEZI|nr:hypothetical protein CONLIGDRAFT_668831 [Coniochaeta ligniaria NRRL 30616]
MGLGQVYGKRPHFLIVIVKQPLSNNNRATGRSISAIEYHYDQGKGLSYSSFVPSVHRTLVNIEPSHRFPAHWQLRRSAKRGSQLADETEAKYHAALEHDAPFRPEYGQYTLTLPTYLLYGGRARSHWRTIAGYPAAGSTKFNRGAGTWRARDVMAAEHTEKWRQLRISVAGGAECHRRLGLNKSAGSQITLGDDPPLAGQAELRGEVASVRGEIASLRGEVSNLTKLFGEQFPYAPTPKAQGSIIMDNDEISLLKILPILFGGQHPHTPTPEPLPWTRPREAGNVLLPGQNKMDWKASPQMKIRRKDLAD